MAHLERSVCGTVCLLLCAGCMAPYGNGGYGSGYVGQYGMPQGGTIYQPGTMPSSTPPVVINGPGTTYPPASGTYPPTGTAPSNGRITEIPLPSNSPSSPPKSVPNYRDPSNPSSRPQTGGSPLDGESDEFPKPTSLRPQQPANMQLQSFTDDSEQIPGDDSFAAPRKLPANAYAAPLQEDDSQSIPARPNPYSYDRKGYTWLRGIVDFDANANQWYITYALDPQPEDVYQGRLYLADDSGEKLSVLVAKEVALIEGRLDLQERDPVGKPVYRVATASPLRPKGPGANLSSKY